MSEPVAIPSDGAAVIDTSVLFAMGGPENEKYRAFERAVSMDDRDVVAGPEGYDFV